MEITMRAAYTSSATRTCDLCENQLLALLSSEARGRLAPHLETVTLPLGEVLYESGGRINYVYFPTSSIVSLIYITENGATAEIGMVGFEGVVGISLLMGSETMPNEAVVRSAGSALRMRADVMQAELARVEKFQGLLLRYIQAFFTQVSTVSACIRLHPVEQQLCCMLLLSHDRSRSNKMAMTHELLANLMGVRRKSITVAAGRLQERGLISYARGTVTMLDRESLEAEVCECYRVVKDEYDRLLGCK